MPLDSSETHPFLNELAERLSSGHAAVMIGSGFSKNAIPRSTSDSSLPDWSELGDILYEKLHGKLPRTDAKYLDILTLADELQAALGRPALNQILRDAIPDMNFEPSPLHSMLLSLNWTDVFTTNYDTLLERALEDAPDRRYDVVVTPNQLVYSIRPRIIKLHGSFSSPSTYVITADDYRSYPQKFSPFVNTVRQSLIENTLCLIGFRGNDPNFLQWIRWIHDNLGIQNSPKLYLVSLSRLSEPQKKLLHQHNISLVDVSAYGDPNATHHTRLKALLEYLSFRQTSDDRLRWPFVESDLLEPKRDVDNHQQLNLLLHTWKAARLSFPGWVIVPEDRRRELWLYTHRWISFICDNCNPLDPTSIELVYEMSWRMNKCLCPLLDNQAATIESVLDAYPPRAEPHSATTPTSKLSDSERRPAREHMRHYLLLSLLRYYRLEGDEPKWTDRHRELQHDINELSPEHKADYHYQESLQSLFHLSLQNLRETLAHWPSNDALPLWEARRAGLLAESGQPDDALRIVEQSLKTIRSQLNLKPIATDYALVSQESYVMLLLSYFQGAAEFRRGRFDSAQEAVTRFSDRWNVLKQYKCDPWTELSVLEHSLDKSYVKRSRRVQTKLFDIGEKKATAHFGWIDSDGREALIGWQFLLLHEDAGIPFRIPGGSFSTTPATGALPRISGYSLHWAVTMLARISDEDAVERVFDRDKIAATTRGHIDNIAQRYLTSLDENLPYVRNNNYLYEDNFAVSFDRVAPETLSRLCCKCSLSIKHQIVEYLRGAYQRANSSSCCNVASLAKRLLNSLSSQQRLNIVPQFLDFPIPSNWRPPVDRLLHNPLTYLEFDSYVLSKLNKPSVQEGHLYSLLDQASTSTSSHREWALQSLQVLHGLELLDSRQSRRFSELLWQHRDERGFPTQPEQPNYQFLELPHPAELDVVALFKTYVRDASFPVQGSKSGVTLHKTWRIGLVGEIVGAAGTVDWTDEESDDILGRLFSWWRADRERLKSGDDMEPLSTAGEFHGRFTGLLRAIATIARPGVSLGEGRKGQLLEVIKEMRDYGVRTLHAEGAILHMFPEMADDVFQRIGVALASDDEGSIVDCLGSILKIVERVEDRGITSQLGPLLDEVGRMNKWMAGPIVRHALEMTGRIARQSPELFVDDLERCTLIGLRRIANYTTAEGSAMDLFDKLQIREAGALLAYRLNGLFVDRVGAAPGEVQEWEAICRSDEEFDDIRNQWVYPE